MDQYVEQDESDQKAHPDHELHRLHHRLYSNVQHAGGVYYVLVCSVALGEPSRTKDGHTELDGGGALFESGERRALKQAGRHALLAELGERIQRFREVVVFAPEAIQIELLVAVRRCRRYCDCTQPQRAATVARPHHGWVRPMLVCPRSVEPCPSEEAAYVCRFCDGRFVPQPPPSQPPRPSAPAPTPCQPAASCDAHASLSVSELKRLIAAHGGSDEGCLEKADLLRRLVEVENVPSPSTSRPVAAGAAGSGDVAAAADEAIAADEATAACPLPACRGCSRSTVRWHHDCPSLERTLHVCASCMDSAWSQTQGIHHTSEGCGFVRALPECHCGLAAQVHCKKRDGTPYYGCGVPWRGRTGWGWEDDAYLNEDRCNYVDWNGPQRAIAGGGSETLVDDVQSQHDSGRQSTVAAARTAATFPSASATTCSASASATSIHSSPAAACAQLPPPKHQRACAGDRTAAISLVSSDEEDEADCPLLQQPAAVVDLCSSGEEDGAADPVPQQPPSSQLSRPHSSQCVSPASLPSALPATPESPVAACMGAVAAVTATSVEVDPHARSSQPSLQPPVSVVGDPTGNSTPPLTAGEMASYRTIDGSHLLATVCAVHPGTVDDPEPYYTVRLPDGSQRGTIGSRLSRVSNGASTPFPAPQPSHEWHVRLGGTFLPYSDAAVQCILEQAYATGKPCEEVTVCGVVYVIEGLNGPNPTQVAKHADSRRRSVRRVPISSCNVDLL